MKAESEGLGFRPLLAPVRSLKTGQSRSRMEDRARSLESDSAFWLLFDPLKHRLYNFVRKSLNFGTHADDVYQETVLHAWMYFASFNSERDFKAWVYAIACNEIKKSFRGVRRLIPLGNAEKSAVSLPDDTSSAVQEIFRYAARLRPRERKVFFLFYESGFSISEIAEISGLGESHIKQLLFRARNDLKNIIGIDHE